ncbi:MAG: N-acetyltransferase [Crocinitomicaceae bacterium]|nr:MAG: N-acetyltransferase [Crocinitomicaceae bacterium]
MTEALGLVLNHGFEKMQLNRIEAYVSPNNFPSLSLLTRFNFIEEGTLKRHYFTNGIYEDSILLAKLAESNFN